MPTLTRPSYSTAAVRSSSRTRRRSLVTLTMLMVALVAAVALLAGRSVDQTYADVLVATARPGVSSADLLALEGEIVGPDAVVDPATGRLPDVAAFRRVGVSTLRVNDGTLSAEFLPEATAGQRESVRAVLFRSPLIASVRQMRRKR